MQWSEILRRAGRLGMAIALTVGMGEAAATAGEPRLNQIQVIGTHNSYHLAPTPSILQLIGTAGKSRADGLDYTHRPFGEQFGRLGIRQIELDVFADPKGGLFAEPNLRKMVKNRGKDPGPDPDVDGQLRKPGIKVLHVQDVDFRTHAATFVDALKQVRTWSKANPRHVPILILVEIKEESVFALPTKPVSFGPVELDGLEAEILSVFDRSEVLTPDRVRGRFSTLPEAIKAQGWPALEDVRGLVMFAMDNENAVRDRYLKGHPALQDRLMFTTVAPSHPAAAWFKVNDPIKDFNRIQKLVRDGFLVRTRADVDTAHARSNDTTLRDKALASGAQFVSTDYPEPDRRFTEYAVKLPGGVVARPNPVSGDPAWGRIDLESARP